VSDLEKLNSVRRQLLEEIRRLTKIVSLIDDGVFEAEAALSIKGIAKFSELELKIEQLLTRTLVTKERAGEVILAVFGNKPEFTSIEFWEAINHRFPCNRISYGRAKQLLGQLCRKPNALIVQTEKGAGRKAAIYLMAGKKNRERPYRRPRTRAPVGRKKVEPWRRQPARLKTIGDKIKLISEACSISGFSQGLSRRLYDAPTAKNRVIRAMQSIRADREPRMAAFHGKLTP